MLGRIRRYLTLALEHVHAGFPVSNESDVYETVTSDWAKVEELHAP